MFKYTFTKLVDTDPETHISLDVWCEADEKTNGEIGYSLHIGTLYTNRRKEDGTWETWGDEDNSYSSENPYDILRTIGFLCLAKDDAVLNILGLLIHSTKQLH